METISHSKPKARKKYFCNFCSFIIQKGEIYDNTVYVYDGIYSWKAHIKCGEIASKLRMYDECDEGVTMEDFYEYIKEEFKNIWFKKDREYYKSDKFICPNFKDQLDFVINHHNLK